MKAILVIDMPEACRECPCFHMLYDICRAPGGFDADWDKVPPTCPLKPMPEQKEEMSWRLALKQPYSSGFIEGWNACLDAIERSKG